MTDLEMTKLCAEAMGCELTMENGKPQMVILFRGHLTNYCDYDPLHDDAQAMALVKKFHIALGWNKPGWAAFGQHDQRWIRGYDLNRAIVECVAKMQKALV